MSTLTPEQARMVPRVPIFVGGEYTFYAEMQQEYEPPGKRMRNWTGQRVKVLRVNEESDWFKPYIEDGEWVRPQVSKSFIVRPLHGPDEFCAMEEELDGWDKMLGQYFWPDGTYGPEHGTQFLVNERTAT